MPFHTFDPDDVLQEFGDPEVVSELVGIVRADLETYAARIEEACARHELMRVRELAHAIKGSVANVSARQVRELAARIDDGLRAGQTTVVGLVPELLLECQRLRAELGLWLEVLGGGQQSH